MNIIYVPIVGFFVAAYRIHVAQSVYFTCNAKGLPCWAEYNATWKPFDDFGVSVIVTMSFLVLMIIVMRILGER